MKKNRLFAAKHQLKRANYQMIKHILLLDNYDSFTFNLHHYLEKLGAKVTVVRNDQLEIHTAVEFDAIVLSPGPGLPEESGCMMELIQAFSGIKPFLGVCLGHQALAIAHGAKLLQLPNVLHGVSSNCSITQRQDVLFQNLPASFAIGHYHSWVVDPSSLNNHWRVTAEADGLVMAMSHLSLPLHGVQFHPESILTEMGLDILQNWLTSL
jgi:anthranilate synthase component 2